MELVSLRCNRDFTSASSYGLGWYKYAIATQWYQCHTTDAWWFSLMNARIVSLLSFDSNHLSHWRTQRSCELHSYFQKQICQWTSYFCAALKWAIHHLDKLVRLLEGTGRGGFGHSSPWLTAGTHFTYSLWAFVIECCTCLFNVIKSGHNFARVMTAQLSWHVQIMTWLTF